MASRRMNLCDWHRFLCSCLLFSICQGQALMPEAPAQGAGLLQSLYSTKADPQVDSVSALQLMQSPQMFLQPTSLQMPSRTSMMQLPEQPSAQSVLSADSNLRRPSQIIPDPLLQPQQMGTVPTYAMPQMQMPSPQLWGQMPQMQMPMPYQQVQPLGLQQVQAGSWMREQAMEQQFMAMRQELQVLKEQEAKQAKDLELKSAEADVADKKVEEAERKMKDADAAAKQLQDREQKVEDQAISAVRTAKAQVSQAQKEVKQMQDELRQAQADAIQARAAQAAAEEQVAKAEMLQAAQAQSDINKDMLGALSSVKRSQAFEVGSPQ
ncbi:PCM1 [Symbiodinium sp. CCMP2456]|nr:PCM1 [Symbiodinium sp. CCMP2456]